MTQLQMTAGWDHCLQPRAMVRPQQIFFATVVDSLATSIFRPFVYGCLFSFAVIALLQPATASAFTFQEVVDKARMLAAASYQAPQPIPGFMTDLSYSQYQDIRFDQQKSLWRQSLSPFQVMLVPPGLFFTHAVTLNIVDGQEATLLPFRPDYFICNDPSLAERLPPDLGYAGFKLTFPMHSNKEANQFMVFAGASYFRAVGSDNAFGLSARGLALDIGLPAGEEFPSFIEFWLVRPPPEATQMQVYALLNGRSVTGAYAFTINPGPATTVAVAATIFARTPLQLPGLAPLTSMFYYGDNTSRPVGEWRRQVHDSDGLLIYDGVSNEWLWRPLLNPKSLQVDTFTTGSVKGFGLFQRDQTFDGYLDAEAGYHRRPSAWVETQGEWGPGRIMLVQLPSANETNDNIVAFWTPDEKVMPETPCTLAYTLHFGNADIGGEKTGRAVKTLVGDGNRIGGGNIPGAYRLIVDFSGGALDHLGQGAKVTAKVTALGGCQVLDQHVEYIPGQRCWRLSILASPAADSTLALRAFLASDRETLTETWTYRLPADNDIHPEGE